MVIITDGKRPCPPSLGKEGGRSGRGCAPGKGENPPRGDQQRTNGPLLSVEADPVSFPTETPWHMDASRGVRGTAGGGREEDAGAPTAPRAPAAR